MAELISIAKESTKTETYEQLLPQIEALIGDDRDVVAVLSNCASAIHYAFGFLWTGFYFVKGDELVLGPFQGPVACMRIKIGRGVSGAVLERGESILVPDVDQFPGHIACSSESRSEIVVPIYDKDRVIRAVMDVDSIDLSTFDEVDKENLEKLCNWLGQRLF